MNIITCKGKGISILFILCFVFLSGVLIYRNPVKAANISNAQNYTLGNNVNGVLTDNDKTYRFKITSSGRITMDVTTNVYRTNYYIYNDSGDTVWEKTWQYINSTTGQMHLEEDIDLTSGNYYMQIEKSSGDDDTFSFKMTFAGAQESFAESGYGTNNSITTANIVGFNKNYIGQIAENDEKDMYKFTLGNSGSVMFGLTAYIYRTNYYLYDMNGEKIWERTWQYWNDTSLQMRLDVVLDLTAGSYIFVVEKSSGTGNYNFLMKYTSANESFSEQDWGSNNDITKANAIQTGVVYNGQIADNDEKDFYKFVTSSSINLMVNASIYRSNYYIYDAQGNQVWERTWQYWDDTTHVMTFSEKVTLSSGTYYLAVERCGEYTGNYNFKITNYRDLASISLSKKKIILDTGKKFTLKASFRPGNATNKKVQWKTSDSYVATVTANGVIKAKSYGSAVVTVRSEENDDISRSCLVIVRPKKVKVTRVATYKILRSKKRGATVYYSVPGGADGVQVVYAKSKSMKKAKKVKGYLKLKKGTYYFKARAYTLVNGKKYYGSWGKVKKKKVK